MHFCYLSRSRYSVFIKFVLHQWFNILLCDDWKVAPPHHFINTLPWMFWVNFCRTCSGISICVHIWAGYQILPCLAQTVIALTHYVFYFDIVFAFFAVVCIQLLVIVVVMKIINIITFFGCSSCSSDDIFIGASRFQKAIHTTKLCTHWIPGASRSLSVLSKLSHFSTIKKSNRLVHPLTSDLVILITALSLRISISGYLKTYHVSMHFLQLNL